MSLLFAQNLWFTIKGKHILRRLNLSIPPEEFHALIGTNGTGKSTLVKPIIGYEAYVPTRGDIVFHDRVINKLCIYQRALRYF